MSLELNVNGEKKEYESVESLADLVELEAGADSGHLAVAVNSEVIPVGDWGGTALSSDDEIEIVQPIQGG